MPTPSATRRGEIARQKKEKEQAELEAVQRLDEEKKARAEKKKVRVEARKLQEEEEKIAEEMEAAEAALKEEMELEVSGNEGEEAPMDTADVDINAHLADINEGAREDINEDDKEEDVIRSPQRKKNRKEKTRKADKKANRKKKKSKHNKKETAREEMETSEEEEIVTPVLRRGRFSMGGDGSIGKQMRTATTYNHKHKRWVLECSLILRSEGLDKYPEMQHALKMLLQNGRKVDPTFVIEPVVEGKGGRIDNPEDIPINFTDLSVNVKVSGGAKAFEMKTPWRKDGDTRDEEELQDPEVYFAIAFSSDEKPEDVVDRISCEWGRLNGKKMWLKAINSFKTETPVAIYHMLNSAHHFTIIAELKGILEEAKDRETEVDMFYAWADHEIPELGLRLNVPKIPGQDTSVFQGWPRRMQWNRKVIHVECDCKASAMIQDLVAAAKRRGLFSPV